MATTATTVRSDRFYDRYTTPSMGALLVTYALALVFVWFGCLKFTQYEAAGIAPFVMNSPAVTWWHSLFGIAGTSHMLGIYEILTGLLLAARLFSARLASIGGAMATIGFLVTVSFMFSTPGVVQPGFDNPLALSAVPGQFLLKDVVLLAVSIWILFAARAEARAS